MDNVIVTQEELEQLKIERSHKDLLKRLEEELANQNEYTN